MIHRARASIDFSALAENLRTAKKHAAGGSVAAVVKADAYGHGLIPAAEALSEADLLAVTDVREAETLTLAGFDKPVLIMQGIIEPDDIPLLVENRCQLVVHSLEQLALLDAALSRKSPPAPMTFWLKMNSGMGRLGIDPSAYAQAWRKLAARPYTGRVIAMTHLANGSLVDSALNRRQLDTFENVRRGIGDDTVASVSASAALLSGLTRRCDWARPGIMLYGSSPFPYRDETMRRDRFGLRAAMTLESKIIAIQELAAGDNVGYCSQFICPEDMRVGIVSIGYADGYPSNAPNGTPVLVGGKRSRTLGRVSMDMIAIDLSDLPEARIDDAVTLWGKDLNIDEVADVTGIISYNLLCSVSPRVERVYV